MRKLQNRHVISEIQNKLSGVSKRTSFANSVACLLCDINSCKESMNATKKCNWQTEIINQQTRSTQNREPVKHVIRLNEEDTKTAFHGCRANQVMFVLILYIESKPYSLIAYVPSLLRLAVSLYLWTLLWCMSTNLVLFIFDIFIEIYLYMNPLISIKAVE